MMRQRLFLSTFIFTILFAGCSFLNSTNKPSLFESVVNPKTLTVTPPVEKLLTLTDVTCSKQLSDVVAATQAAWLRKPGTERWDMQEFANESKKAEIMEQFNQLHMIEAVKPSLQEYEYAMLLGAAFKTMAARMNYLIDCWNNGIRFKHIVLLAGARPATASIGETEESFKQYAGVSELSSPVATETDMIRLIYNYSNMPEDMKKVPVTVIDVPMQKNDKGEMRRPNTADTIEAWLALNPNKGNILAVSNQPFVTYQASVLATLIPHDFKVDTVGNVAAQNSEINVLLDTLARVLYQEKQRLQ